jgi:hypothetical protein
MEPDFLLFALSYNAPRCLQMELIELQCDNNLSQNISEKDKHLQDFIPTCQKKSFRTQILLVENNDQNVWQHLCV